ncbi:MAG: 3-isopropylmalate dehydratase small subunit [Methanomicrobiales archaeon]|nr:3-isopropylmalate dehydratase small subunit [Methanomicrobiales archaeon]
MRVWKFGDDVDTDAIIPGRFLTINDPRELAEHAFEGVRPEFAREVREGDVVVAGRNFGCGSSREHAPHALLGAGVRVVIARSFARIFYRNAINTGLLALVCGEADDIEDGDTIIVDTSKAIARVSGIEYQLEPIPAFLQEIVNAGGLVEYAKKLKELPLCTELR